LLTFNPPKLDALKRPAADEKSGFNNFYYRVNRRLDEHDFHETPSVTGRRQLILSFDTRVMRSSDSRNYPPNRKLQVVVIVVFIERRQVDEFNIRTPTSAQIDFQGNDHCN
jgi:hypothetical protein